MDTTTIQADKAVAELSYLRTAIEHAPQAKPRPAKSDMRGILTGNGNYICASCAGRIIDRGCFIPKPNTIVWLDEASPAPCVLCQQ